MNELPESLFDGVPNSRADQVFARFKAFHEANPHVWTKFEELTLGRIALGFTHYGAKAIIERLRWEFDTPTADDDVKINNNFFPYYARMFHAKHPEHARFFRLRRRTTENKAALKDDSLRLSGPPDDEASLTSKLAAM